MSEEETKVEAATEATVTEDSATKEAAPKKRRKSRAPADKEAEEPASVSGFSLFPPEFEFENVMVMCRSAASRAAGRTASRSRVRSR